MDIHQDAARAHTERLASLGLMTAGLAHDLRNHLQVAAAAIHLLEWQADQATPRERRDWAEGASEALQRASALTRRIVDFPRDERARDLCVDVDEALSDLRDALCWAVGPGLRLRLELSGGPSMVRCDIREFENAVLNLVANARDSSPPGSLIVIAVRTDPYSPSVLVAVRDNGSGMSTEAAHRAFDPFFTTKPAGVGAGLGLALVADFARRAGGDVCLDTAPGEGSTVVLRLPGAPPAPGRKRGIAITPA